MSRKELRDEFLGIYEWLKGQAEKKFSLRDSVLGRDSDRSGIAGVLHSARDDARQIRDTEIPLLMKGVREGFDLDDTHLSQQNRANAKQPREPKTPKSDEEFAIQQARHIFPQILEGVPTGHGRISKALEKTMNVEFAPGKRIRDYADKEPLRQILTRKKPV